MTAPPMHHIALFVRDLEAAEGFYRGLLGLPLERRWPRQDAPGDRSVWLRLGEGRLMLERAGGGARRDADGGGWHMLAIGIEVAERGAWERRLADAGVQVVERSAYTLYFEDTEGNRIGLSHWPEGFSD